MLLDENFWLTQSATLELFGRAKSTIREHIKNVYYEGELEEFSPIRKYRTVQLKGKRVVELELEHCSLDFIIYMNLTLYFCVGLLQMTSIYIFSERRQEELRRPVESRKVKQPSKGQWVLGAGAMC